MQSDVIHDASYAGLSMNDDILGLERRRRWSDEKRLETVLPVGVERATVMQLMLPKTAHLGRTYSLEG